MYVLELTLVGVVCVNIGIADKGAGVSMFHGL